MIQKIISLTRTLLNPTITRISQKKSRGSDHMPSTGQVWSLYFLSYIASSLWYVAPIVGWWFCSFLAGLVWNWLGCLGLVSTYLALSIGNDLSDGLWDHIANRYGSKLGHRFGALLFGNQSDQGLIHSFIRTSQLKIYLDKVCQIFFKG